MRLVQIAGAAVLAAAFVSHTQAASTLDAPAANALKTALSDEYHAEAFYDAVIKKFGDVRPFTNIIEAERTHARELLVVMAAYGMAAEPNGMLGTKEIADAVPTTIEEACKAGVAAEIANRDLYGPLIAAAGSHADIVAVFTRLQQASEKNHLPAFERCASGRGGGQNRP